MSQEGFISLFTTAGSTHPREDLSRLIAFAGFETVWIATTEPETSNWHRWKNDLRPQRREMLCDQPRDAVVLAFSAGVHLSMQFSRCGSIQWVADAIAAAIPEEIAGDFKPWRPIIGAGWHDVWEASENDEGTFFGRAFFSFSINGYSSPNHWKEYRRRIFEVPAVREFKAQLEAIIGPCEQCVYWNT